MSLPPNVNDWTCHDVQRFAQEKGFMDLIEILKREELDGQYVDMWEQGLTLFEEKHGRAFDFLQLVKTEKEERPFREQRAEGPPPAVVSKKGQVHMPHMPSFEEIEADGAKTKYYPCLFCKAFYLRAQSRKVHMKRPAKNKTCNIRLDELSNDEKKELFKSFKWTRNPNLMPNSK